MPVKFCPIASGSSGNSVYIGTAYTHILIDAGLSGKQTENNLAAIDVNPACLDAIFITHEHGDHIKGAGILSRRYNIPIYTTCGTWEEINRIDGKIDERNKRIIYKEENCIINDMCIRPFEIPHDGRDPVGYSVYAENHKVTVATDIGHVTDTLAENITDSEALLLESNHDVEMLKKGSYPEVLKRRILGKNGHLSNDTCGKLLSEIFNSRMKYVYLGHLSEENNRPELAYKTVVSILDSNRISKHIKLQMADRYIASKPVLL